MSLGLITPELEALVGEPWPPAIHEVERTGMRMWAAAVGIADLVYHDEAVARERGFERLPAPPGFLGVARHLPGEPDPGPPIRGLNPALQRSLNGGTEYEHVAAVMAGDELVATTAITGLKERDRLRRADAAHHQGDHLPSRRRGRRDPPSDRDQLLNDGGGDDEASHAGLRRGREPG